MANAYVDLGTWWCVTPFIGAGIGTSYNRISGFQDTDAFVQGGAPINSVFYGDDAGKWNFAWAAYAGLSYQVTRERQHRTGLPLHQPGHRYDGTHESV